MRFYPDDSYRGPRAGQIVTAAATCSRCGHGGLAAEAISTAFWREKRLVVIRDIPAFVCPACREEFIADETARVLDRMGSLAYRAKAVDRMDVPVLSFDAARST